MRIEFIISGGHATKLLEAAEKLFDRVALGVAGGIVRPRMLALAPGRNYGTGAAGSERSHQGVGIVAAVGHQVGRGQAFEQRQSLRGVVTVAGAEAAAHRPATGVGGHMQLTGQPAAAAAQGLRPVFLRAPLAC